MWNFDAILRKRLTTNLDITVLCSTRIPLPFSHFFYFSTLFSLSTFYYSLRLQFFICCVCFAHFLLFSFFVIYIRIILFPFSYHVFLLTLHLRSAPSMCQCQQPGSVSRCHLLS